MGQAMDEWLLDDDNLEKWEATEKGKGLTALERRILMAHWFSQGLKRALKVAQGLQQAQVL